MKEHKLVVGGTRGIGREIALRWAKAGAAVTVVARKAAEVPGAAVVALDARDAALPAALAKLAAEKGPVSAVAFCQRFRGEGDEWAGELAVQLDATKRLVDALKPHLAPGAGLVVLGSVAGARVTADHGPGYHAAKTGLAGLVRWLAVDLAPKARVNMVSPGLVIKEEAREFYKGRPDLTGLFADITPLGRMAETAEIASVVDFLCGPGASFVTGQELVVDGGLSLGYTPPLARRLKGVR